MTLALQLEQVEIWRVGPAGRVSIVQELDWAVAPGEVWALLGPNGAGKTTLLTMAAAVEFPSHGTATILGERMGRVDVFALRERIGFVDGRVGRRLAPELTVRQVVETGATQTIGWFPDRIAAEQAARCTELLEVFGVERLAGRRFLTCSHGERTRTLIARALVPRPRLLLLDEPGSGLDLAGRETLLGALDRLVESDPSLATVITTHHLEELPRAVTHALLLGPDGLTIAQGQVDTVLADGPLSACFGLPVRCRRDETGRWSAVAGGHEP
ncbi:MAG: ABC transporter ATP-binding protein [Gaiella sp.]